MVAWGKIAENYQQYLTSGRQVYVEGSLHTRQDQDKEGQSQKVTEITVQRVIFLGAGEMQQKGFCRKVTSNILLFTISSVFHVPSFQYVV